MREREIHIRVGEEDNVFQENRADLKIRSCLRFFIVKKINRKTNDLMVL